MVNKIQIPVVLPILQSKQLTLRAMNDTDAGALLEIYGDPRVMNYTDLAPFPGLDTVALMLKSLRHLLAQGEYMEWAIVLRNSGELIGTCGLHTFDKAHRMAEVGCLLRQSAWGKGYMADAIGLLTAYARDVLQLKRLCAAVAPENERAQCLFKKLGYRQERSGMLETELHPCA